MDDLLELAHQGKQIDETQSVALDEVAADAWSESESEGSTFAVDFSIHVLASRSRLRQLLENLLQNAVVHGSPAVEGDTTDYPERASAGSPSATRTDRTDVTIRIGALHSGFYLEDDGVGIPDAERSQVFEQGYTSEANGTGLGFAIVSRIVDAHGWSIRVTESADGGARFEITDVESASESGDQPAASSGAIENLDRDIDATREDTSKLRDSSY